MIEPDVQVEEEALVEGPQVVELLVEEPHIEAAVEPDSDVVAASKTPRRSKRESPLPLSGKKKEKPITEEETSPTPSIKSKFCNVMTSCTYRKKR